MWRLFTKPYCQKKLELQAFLGLLNFYHNGLPNKAEGAKHRLLDSGKDTNPHFIEQPLTFTCDALLYGVGCVLAHKLPCA
ncbi:hypothetical protein T08_14759 [Trichinella sp. T8]|nr:hypothetical protein T08_14759 [Trichinella sp. T8]